MDYFIFPALLTVIITLSGCYNAAPASEKTLMTETVKNVQISGDASRIHLTSDIAQAMTASMGAKPTGWLTGWFYNECKAAGDMVITGDSLIIKVRNDSWYDWSDCVSTLTINIPANSVVTIDQPAFIANLNGQFANLNIDTKAADIVLRGTAKFVKIRGEALRTDLQFIDTTNSEQPELIEINGRALDTTLIFSPAIAVNYRIQANASLLDSKLPNDQTAKTKINISGDYIRTTIR